MVVLTFKGEAYILEKNRSDSRLILNSIQILPPNRPHTGAILRPLTYVSVYIHHMVTKKYARKLSNNYFSYPVFKRPTSFLNELEVNKIVKSMSFIGDSSANLEEKDFGLTEMLSAIFQSNNCKDFTKKEYWKIKEGGIKNLVDKLIEDVDKKMTHEKIENLTGLNYRSVRETLGRKLGCTVNDLRNFGRIEKAEKLLKDTDFSIEMISQSSGYDTLPKMNM